MNIQTNPNCPTAKKWIALPKRAADATIQLAIATLTQEWEADAAAAPILFCEGGEIFKELPGTYYLQIGKNIEWGYCNGLSGYGFDKADVDAEVAGIDWNLIGAMPA